MRIHHGDLRAGVHEEAAGNAVDPGGDLQVRTHVAAQIQRRVALRLHVLVDDAEHRAQAGDARGGRALVLVV